MSRLNDPENFAGRVNYAAAVISNRRATSRAFDNCFENNDGDEVAVILYRRSLKNPKLAANIWRYLSQSSVMPEVERLKDVSTRDMAEHARQTRERARAEFQKWLADQDAA